MGGDVVGDGELVTGQVRGIPLHIVKQHRQNVGLENFVDKTHFFKQRLAFAIVVVMRPHGAQAHAEGEPVGAALARQLGEIRQLLLGPGQGPVLAQIAILFRCVDIEAVTVARQPLGVAGAGMPAPSLAKKAFNHPQIGSGGRGPDSKL